MVVGSSVPTTILSAVTDDPRLRRTLSCRVSTTVDLLPRATTTEDFPSRYCGFDGGRVVILLVSSGDYSSPRTSSYFLIVYVPMITIASVVIRISVESTPRPTPPPLPLKSLERSNFSITLEGPS